MIIDSNILFSLMKPDSTASTIFAELKLALIAPEFIMAELNKHEKECLAKSGLSKAVFAERKRQIMSRITLVKVEAYKDFLEEAARSIPDIDDAPYLALAIALKQPIWSNDNGLKLQSLVNVFSTEEMVKLFS